MQVACHAITWGPAGFDRAIEEIHQLGFHAIEPFSNVIDSFGFDRIDAFRDVLSAHDLRLIALYGGGAMHDPSMVDVAIASNLRIARFLAANDADILVLGPGRRGLQPPSEVDLLTLAHCANEIGRRSSEFGVQACIHPHVNTVMETEAEIDFVMNRLDPRYVGMAADTAHIAKGNPESPGIEVAVFRKYADRIKYVHLKDWNPDLLKNRPVDPANPFIQDFTELGHGRVDLKGCFGALEEAGFDGWLAIELDYTTLPPMEAVRLGRDYVQQEFGLSL